MKFYDRQQQLRKIAADQGYKAPTEVEYAGMQQATAEADAMVPFLELVLEQRWELDRRPFYNVWPAASAICQNIKLNNIRGSYLNLPLTSLVLRFPETGENPLGNNPLRIRTLAILPLRAGPEGVKDDYASMQASIKAPEGVLGPYSIPAVLLNVQFDKLFRAAEDPKFTPKDRDFTLFADDSMLLSRGSAMSVEEFMDWHNDAYQPDELEALRFCVKLFAFVCFIDEQSELLDRRVLNADQEKYQKTGDPKFVDKAIRRGVNGWDIGRRLETVPHLRRKHFAIRWMGHGADKEPVVRPIKGSVVHRNKLKEVPTGYLDDIEPPTI